MMFPRTARNAPAQTPSGGDSKTGLALMVIMAGVLMTAVDTTIVVLALPEIQRSLHVALTNVVWVITSFLLVITLLSTQVGRLGDMFGRVRMYETGFAVFVLGSLLCALAWDEVSIIVFRVVQGIGGALIMANSGAVIADLYPREQRGRAYGFTSLGWTIGAVLGVVLGGLIVTYLSWRWIFWINVPTGIVAIGVALRVLHDKGERVRQRLDPLGMVTLGLGLFGVLWAITKLANEPFDASTAGYLVGGLALIGVFALVESRVAAPMLPLRIFKVPTMAASLCASLFQGLASFAVLFLVLMYLQGPRGLSPIHASLLLLPGYLISAGVSLYAGRLSDKYGAVLPATAGLALQVVALVLYAQLSNSTPLWWIVCIGTLSAVGACFFFPANSSAIMKAAPPDMFGIASGMLRTFSNIGMVFSFAVAILVASRSISRQLAFAIFVGTTSLHGQAAAAFTTGLHAAFYESVGFMVLAAVLSALRGGRSSQQLPPDYNQPLLMESFASASGARPSSPARTLSSIILATPTITGAISLRLAASDGSATSCGTSARSRMPGRSASWPPSQPSGSCDSSRSKWRESGSHLRVKRGWWWVRLKLPGLPSTASSRSTRQIGLPAVIGIAE
jgi:EmrB/QacA subfamily drug resistance transporter